MGSRFHCVNIKHNLNARPHNNFRRQTNSERFRVTISLPIEGLIYTSHQKHRIERFGVLLFSGLKNYSNNNSYVGE